MIAETVQGLVDSRFDAVIGAVGMTAGCRVRWSIPAAAYSSLKPQHEYRRVPCAPSGPARPNPFRLRLTWRPTVEASPDGPSRQGARRGWCLTASAQRPRSHWLRSSSTMIASSQPGQSLPSRRVGRMSHSRRSAAGREALLAERAVKDHAGGDKDAGGRIGNGAVLDASAMPVSSDTTGITAAQSPAACRERRPTVRQPTILTVSLHNRRPAGEDRTSQKTSLVAWIAAGLVPKGQTHLTNVGTEAVPPIQTQTGYRTGPINLFLSRAN